MGWGGGGECATHHVRKHVAAVANDEGVAVVVGAVLEAHRAPLRILGLVRLVGGPHLGPGTGQLQVT